MNGSTLNGSTVIGPPTISDSTYVRNYPRLSYVQPTDPWLTRQLISSIETVFGRAKVEAMYSSLKEQPFDVCTFFGLALDKLGIDVSIDQHRLRDIPKQGPVVFVANHPFGIVDGLILCDIVAKLRGNFKILIHAMLCQDDDLADYFLPIDFQESTAALKNNIRSKRLALECLQDGIPLIIFPSGMVSTAGGLGFGEVHESPWSTFAAKLIMQARAAVVPVHFSGRNSRKFHVASHIAEPLRMALLVHEALNKRDRLIKVSLGAPLYWSDVEGFSSRQDLTEFLYDLVASLKAEA